MERTLKKNQAVTISWETFYARVHFGFKKNICLHETFFDEEIEVVILDVVVCDFKSNFRMNSLFGLNLCLLIQLL